MERSALLAPAQAPAGTEHASSNFRFFWTHAWPLTPSLYSAGVKDCLLRASLSISEILSQTRIFDSPVTVPLVMMAKYSTHLDVRTTYVSLFFWNAAVARELFA